MNKRLKTTLKLIVGLAIFAFLIYQVGLSEIENAIINLKFIYLVPVILLYFLFMLMGSLKYNCLISHYKKIKFKTTFKYYLNSWALGMVSPARIGDFSLAYFLKKEGFEIGKGFAIVITDKIISFIVLAIFSIIGALIFLNPKEIAVIALIFIALIIIGLITISSRKIKDLIKKYLDRLSLFFQTLRDFEHNKKIILKNLFYTILKSVFQAGIMYLLFISFDADISLIQVILIDSLSMIFTWIPITLSGLGIKQSVGLFLYAKLGIDNGIILGNQIIVVIINYLVALFVFIYYLSAKKKSSPQ
jgi:uncharacterized protein (TIRG00374 family)